jgi:hypothetical protein
MMRALALGLAAVLVAAAPARAAQVLPPLVRPGGSRVLGLEVRGDFRAHAFRVFAPGGFVVDLDQAELAGAPVALDHVPGTPIRGLRVFQYKDHTVRAYLDLPEPRRLRCRIVQAGPGRARLEVWLPEPGRTKDGVAKHGPSSLAAAAGTRADAAVAEVLPVRANPLQRFAPLRTLVRATAPVKVAERALRGYRLGGRDPIWQWRSSSQALFTSNVGQFERGAAAWGTRHRMMGFYYEPLPLAKGAVVAHLDHQALRFTNPRYDYQSLLGSVALAHPLAPHLHVFEGGAMLDRQPLNATDLALVDTSLYAGLGTFGNLGPTAAWSATLTAERVAATALAESYYGQALKLRFLKDWGGLATLNTQATLQRIDPVVRTTPYFRGYLEGSLDRFLLANVKAGVQGQAGIETGVQGQQAFFVLGPYMQVTF